jgi:hypothetical protein
MSMLDNRLENSVKELVIPQLFVKKNGREVQIFVFQCVPTLREYLKY